MQTGRTGHTGIGPGLIEVRTITIRELLVRLYRRRILMVVCFVFVMVSVGMVTLLLPKQYESQMKIFVKDDREDPTVSASRTSGGGPRPEVSEAQINSEIELLNSNDLLQKVVESCGLAQFESAARHSAGGPASPLAVEEATRRLAKDLKIAPVRKADIIQISYVSRDPRLVAAVLRKLADLYLEAHLRVHGSPGSYEFFKAQAARYRAQEEAADSKLAEFRQHQNIVTTTQRDVLLQRTSEAESQLMQTDASISEYSKKLGGSVEQLRSAKSRIVTQSRSLPNQYSVERLHTMLVELQNRRTGLLAKFQPNDRLVKEVEDQIANTAKELDGATKAVAVEESTDVNPLRQSLEMDVSKTETALAGLKARRDTLMSQVMEYRSRLLALAAAAEKDEALVREQKEAEDTYNLYARKQEEARVSELLDQQKIANVVIAEQPVEPQIPEKPDVGLNLLLGFILAGFVSVGAGLALEGLNGGVHSASELELLTGLPVLAIASGE